MQQYFKIGKIVSTHGLSGDLILLHSLGKKVSLKDEAIFIEEKKDSFIPYFIISSKARNEKEILIRMENLSTKESAHKLVKKEVWLTEENFNKYAGKSAPISFLGFSIINDDENIGEIIEVIEQPHQVLCKIMIGDNEALIPIHEESLDKVDKKNRKIFVSLPEGLLDLYK